MASGLRGTTRVQEGPDQGACKTQAWPLNLCSITIYLLFALIFITM
jgi:hypothetical protein